MRQWLKRLGVVLIIVSILLPSQVGQKVNAANEPLIPVRVVILYDSSNANTNLASTLYNNVVRVLQWNKLPFDPQDVSGANHPALVDASNNLQYSAAIIVAEGSALDSTDSQDILATTNRGMGAISVLPTGVNTLLQPAFGIATIGNQQVSAYQFTLLQDKFTFAYAGSPVNQESSGRNHTLVAGADIVATFESSTQPTIWTYNYGDGKTVFHNTTATDTMNYWGILLQSILYVMPIGVASPANVMAVNVDDSPMSYYSPEYLQNYYYDFMSNYLRWLAAYQVKSTFYVAFAYSGSISDFWTNPHPLQAVASILRSGNELGLHAGSRHLPLDPEFWGSPSGVQAEINAINQNFDILRQQLSSQFGLTLGDIDSYIATGNRITDFGYQILNDNTTIKYVGQAFAPSISNNQKQGATEQTLSTEASFTYPQVFKDFGQEGSYNLYNLPRIQGAFDIFNYPQDYSYIAYQNLIRTSFESGQPYILFTHPDEADLIDKTLYPDVTPATVFNGMTIFADYIATNYPYYRWETSKQIGDFLSSRTGTLSGQWIEDSNTLQLTLAQADDPIHIKTAKYLNSISGSGTDLTLTFVDTPNNFQSTQYDVVKVASDYFIYPLGQKSLMPVMPAQPFVFQPVAPGQTLVLNPIGDQTAMVGESLSFTVIGIDIGGNSITYSAANLPAGAAFNTATHVFSWTPAAAGVYPGITFSVSDGTATVSETIAITVTGGASTGGEILKTIATGSDDGFSGNWGFYNNLSWYEAGNPGTPYNGFFRFTGINIPLGATITEARLEVNEFSWDIGANLLIKAEKSAAPVAPTSTATHNAKVRTAASVPWTTGFADDAYHNSPDISAVIQELVNAYNYSNGSIQILLDNNGSTGEAIGRTFESGLPVRLYIRWQDGVAPGNRPPLISPIGNKSVVKEQTLTFMVSATDADNDPLTYSAANLPAGAAFNTATHVFSWTPAAAGVYPGITFSVSDGTATVSETITITVTDGATTGGEILKTVATGSDDGFSGNWGFYNNLSWYEAGNPGTPYNGFFRFTGINIPLGATITEARLEVNEFSWDIGANLLIKAEKSAAPVAPTSTATHNAKVRTAASVPWTTGFADNAYHNSPDIKAVIQELVNAYNYSNGSMQILLDNNGSTGEAIGRTFESGLPIRLYIRWQDGAPTGGEILKTIASGSDDGFSGNWGFYNNLSWYEAGNSGAPYNGFFRFTGINIPVGATITEARLEVNEFSWDIGANLLIKAEKTAAPVAPNSTATHNAKVRTAASVPWTTGFADDAYHNSPDISAVIQELVNAYNYSNGSMQILLDNNGSTGEAIGRTFESGLPVRLYIRWQ